MLCAVVIFIFCYFFLGGGGHLLVFYVNFSVKPLNFAPKWSISYFQPIFAAIFVTIAKVKVKVIGDFYLQLFLREDHLVQHEIHIETQLFVNEQK